MAGGVRRLVGHQDPAGGGGKPGFVPGVYHPGAGLGGAPLAAVRRGRLATGCGRRAAGRLHHGDSPGYGGGKARGGAHR